MILKFFGRESSFVKRMFRFAGSARRKSIRNRMRNIVRRLLIEQFEPRMVLTATDGSDTLTSTTAAETLAGLGVMMLMSS